MSSELRKHWTLDPEINFLNHGSFGATPRAVLEHQSGLRTRMEAQPVKFYVRDRMELWAEARKRSTEFVGADEDGFVFVPNATTGVNTALRSFELAPGDEVLVTNHEYNACKNAVDEIAAATGADVNVVELPFPVRSSGEMAERIVQSLSERTKLLLVDHVTSQSGLVMPIAQIAAACREHDVATLIDGAHAPGMIDLNVAELGVDFYTGNFHKWVCTPKGTAFLWIAPQHRENVRPLVISHGANMPADGVVERLHNEFDWVGTGDPTAVLSIPFGIDYMASLVDGGWDEIRRRNRALALQARELLCDALDEEELAPASMIGSLAAVRIPDGDPAPQASPLYLDPDQDRLLFEHGIEVPLIPWPKPPGRLLRVSAQLYNSIEDYERLASALMEVLDGRKHHA